MTHVDFILEEQFLIFCLQKNLTFIINNKIIKKGKLLIFNRSHYFIQFTLMSEKGTKENIEIPFPFKVENYQDEGLCYFDYRLSSLNVSVLPKIPEKVNSVFFNKILEIQVI